MRKRGSNNSDGNMEDRRRTRSQGLPEGEQLIQWDSLQDPVRIEREQAEACRQARGTSAVTNISRREIENSEIPQVTEEQPRVIAEAPQSGEIPPNQQSQEGRTNTTPKADKISSECTGEHSPQYVTENMSEVSQKESEEVTDLLAREEGARARTPDRKTWRNSKNGDGLRGEESRKEAPQIDTAQHYLDDNFSDVMRSSVLGSNISSLFNTTTFDTTHTDQKVTLDWILPDGKNTQLETLRDKHITDFPVPGGNAGAMLVHLVDLEPFYTTNKFLVDLQSGELFVKLQGRWHPAGLMCKKRNFEVDSLMALIQHASTKLKNRIYGRKQEQTGVLTLDMSQVQAPPLPFIPRAENYVKHDRPMSPTMRKNYIKDRAQAAVTYITEYGNTKLWSLERKAPLHKLTQ